MNYRHAFHAGNFADLVKHAVLLAVLDQLKADRAPLRVLDTHAGAGAYSLRGPHARRSGEAEAGVERLMAAGDPPPPLAAVAEAVRRFNADDAVAVYPGSPLFALSRLDARDSYVGCELRQDDHATLAATLRPFGARATAVQADGYEEAARRLSREQDRILLLVDPPFERGDDYARTAALLAARPRPSCQPSIVWTPLKDLETFDGFLGRLEAARPSRLSALQVRLRPLDNPMALNGCALVLVDAPDVHETALAAGRWVAEVLGEAGGDVRWLDLVGSAT